MTDKVTASGSSDLGTSRGKRRLASRGVEGEDCRLRGDLEVDLPWLDNTRGDEDSKAERGDQGEPLGREQEPPLVEPVDDDPGDRGEDELRDGTRDPQQAECER